MFALLKVFFKRLLGKNRRDYDAIIREIVVLSDANRNGQKNFDAVIPTIKDPFLRDAASKLEDAQQIASLQEAAELLSLPAWSESEDAAAVVADIRAENEE